MIEQVVDVVVVPTKPRLVWRLQGRPIRHGVVHRHELLDQGPTRLEDADAKRLEVAELRGVEPRPGADEGSYLAHLRRRVAFGDHRLEEDRVRVDRGVKAGRMSAGVAEVVAAARMPSEPWV